MPYNLAADSFHTKKLCSRFLRAKSIFHMENEKNVVFEAPFGGLGATYAVHLRLINWKARSRLPISYNWTSFARCFRFVTIHAFDRQTDRQTDRRTDRRSSESPRCIQCSAVKTRHGAVNLCWLLRIRCDLDLWPFDLEPRIGCHVVKLCAKFERNRSMHARVIAI